jgi:hydrogenase expression/formation protein HypC
MSLMLFGLMCLAVPAKVVRIDGDEAEVDFGGVVRKANVSLVDTKVGEYVIVHAGYAIQTLDRKEAEETLDMFREILEDSHA